jgi:hypothetical protein
MQSVQDFWIAHFDILNPIPTSLIPGSGAYWGNVTRLANLPVLTVAAIRGIASGGGAEFSMSLDVSFASEKAIFRHSEVGIGKCQLEKPEILTFWKYDTNLNFYNRSCSGCRWSGVVAYTSWSGSNT